MKYFSLILSFLTALFIPAFVFAHAIPIKEIPAANELVEHVPDVLSITFSERVEPHASSIRVFSPSGSEVKGKAVVGSDPHDLLFPIKLTDNGTYTVSWQAVSADDGHFSKGAYTFSHMVGTMPTGLPTPITETSIDYSTSMPEAAAVSIELLAQAFLLAALLLYPRFRLSLGFTDEECHLPDWLYRSFIRGSAVIGVLGGFSYVVIRSIELADLQLIPVLDAIKLFSQTLAGSFAIYRTIGMLVVLIIILIKNGHLFSAKYRAWRFAAIAILLIDMLMRARVSHAAASDFYPVLSVLINFIHLIFKDFWIGGIAFVALLGSVLGSEKKGQVRIRGIFSRYATLSLLIGGVSGCYIVWLHLKSLGNITGTMWGHTFLWLSVSAVPFLLLRLYHVFIAEPRALKALELSQEIPTNKTYFLEMLVGIVVLFLSSMMVITTPPLSAIAPLSESVTSQKAVITLYEKEHDHDNLYLTIRRQGLKGVEVIKNLTVTALNEEKNIGPIVVSGVKKDDIYVFKGTQLNPPGTWKLSVTASRENAYDAVADFTFTYPLQNHSEHHMPRTFDFLARLMLIFAVLVSLLAYVMFRKTRQNLNALN